MGENCTVVCNGGKVNSADIAQAKRKRMMLSEVYVHKSRKLDTDPSKDCDYEVYHIYEFDENDLNVKITPKLSTNCTEPGKIIKVLQNSTGSDTPQLQRLIEKLCAQSKKWSEIQSNQNSNGTTAMNEGNAGDKTAPSALNVERTPRASPPSSTSITKPATTQSTTSSAQVPVIRVKAIESMKDTLKQTTINKPKIVTLNAAKTVVVPNLSLAQQISFEPSAQKPNATNTPTVPSTKSQPIANKQTPIAIRSKPVERSIDVTERQVTVSNKPTSAPTVKLWNNVMQKNAVDKELEYLIVSNKEDVTNDSSVFCLKPSEEVIENATGNSSSSLKIGQVFECVSDEFVEDLLTDKASTTTAQSSSSPLLDTLVKEIANKQDQSAKNQNGDRAITFVPSTNNSCSDFRCNICLKFNETIDDYKRHMILEHEFNMVCQKCHDAFRNQRQFDIHLNSFGKCEQLENVKRSFICIVDPPVVLMKHGKVFAFKCKMCSLAFHNQRNYVQHAQSHAKLFRCKKCPSHKTKPMSASMMQLHLRQH